MRLPFWILITIVSQVICNDSLESALNAVTNRQRNYQDKYADDPYEDSLAFLPRNNEQEDYSRNVNLERALMDYLREADNNDNEEPFQKPSSFRERLKQNVNYQSNNRKSQYDDDSAVEPQQQYYEKYPSPYYPPEYPQETPNLYNMKKRSYYPSMRWESVGMKKRSRAFQPDGPRESLYLLNYAPRDEIFNRIQEDEDTNADYDYQWPAYNQKKWDVLNRERRFPVSMYRLPMYSTHQHKRSSSNDYVPKTTDPKVAKDLTEIFNPKQTTVAPKTTKQKNKTEKSKQVKPNNTKTKIVSPKEKINKNKEVLPTAVPVSKSLQMKKKSIDWSDYFGLDRRKKSEDSLDSDWLMDRYYKAVASKQQDRNRDHDEENAIGFDNDEKLIEMDNKLRSIEETLVDGTLKYTGAHQGVTNPMQSKQIKDRIISRLSAAYSLEKMRRALGEYRRTIAKERQMIKSHNHSVHENVKRMSIGRKAAIDPNQNNEPEDNNIKVGAGNHEYSHDMDTCPQIEAVCDKISGTFGQHHEAVKAVCEMHQMCMLCSDNNWFGPLRRCDVLYLSKINEICGEDTNCRENAGNVLNHTLDVDQSADCAIACPEQK